MWIYHTGCSSRLGWSTSKLLPAATKGWAGRPGPGAGWGPAPLSTWLGTMAALQAGRLRPEACSSCCHAQTVLQACQGAAQGCPGGCPRGGAALAAPAAQAGTDRGSPARFASSPW